MSAPAAPGTRLLIAGLGGQGVVFATRLVVLAAMARGWPVIAAETHGMSQRGGSVLSHVKLGPYPSSLIRRGQAHLLLAFDEGEAVRAVPFLAPGGACIVNGRTEMFDPLGAALNENRIRVHTLPATSLALALGSVALLNTIVVGCAAALGWLPISVDTLRAVLADLAPPLRQPNLDALEAGVRAVTPAETQAA